MSQIISHTLQNKLLTYGIIPSICLSVFVLPPLQAENLSKKTSLVILEGREHGRIPNGANLQQKVQFLTILANEQVERIRTLREEVQGLKNKLHLMQVTGFSEEVGNYKKLFSALKLESVQNKETQNQLEKIIIQLKTDNDVEKYKNNEAETHIVSLMTALESQAFALEKIEENFKQELANFTSSQNNEKNYQQLYAALEQEAAQYKETQNRLEKLVQEMKDENESEKQKINEAELHIAALTSALKEQAISINIIQENYKNQLQNFSSNAEDENIYNTLYAAMEDELAQNRETQNQLEQLIQQLKLENEAEKQKISDSHIQISTLMDALDIQALSFESIQKDYKKEIEQLTSSLGEPQNASDINAALEQELAHTKDSHHQMELLVQTLKSENDVEKQKIIESEAYIVSLMDALETQALSIENRNGDLNISSQTDKNQLAHIIQQLDTENEKDKQKILEAESHISLLMNSLDKLQKDHDQKIQQITHLQQSKDLTTQLTPIFNAPETERSPLSSENDFENETLRHLADALETIQLQHQFVLSSSEKEKQESLQQLIAELNEERTKTNNIQRNLEEIQQIYDQTVKLYNEIYVDHKTAQKQHENLQKELDEQKMNHLVEIDDLEIKLENLTNEFKNENALAQKLQNQLGALLLEAEELKAYNQQYLSKEKESDEIKTTIISQIETLSLQENLLNQTLEELEHRNKIVEEQKQLLQKAGQDKQTLAAQLHAIPYALDEITYLHDSHAQLKQELEELKNTHHQHLQVAASQGEVLSNAQIELEKHKSVTSNHEDTLQHLLEEKESQNALIAERDAEIRRLTDYIAQTEEQIKQQFNAFASNLETEKCKNFDLQKEIADHNNLCHSHHQHVQESHQQIETLKNELALQDQNLLLQKIEMEDYSDRLKQINEEKSRLILQLEMLDEKKQEPISQIKEIEQLNQEIALLRQHHEQEINQLKQQLDQNTVVASNENETKILEVQIERLQVALQQMISEKTQLQSQYQNQLITDRMLTEKMEETIAETEQLKAELEQLKALR